MITEKRLFTKQELDLKVKEVVKEVIEAITTISPEEDYKGMDFGGWSDLIEWVNNKLTELKKKYL